MDKWNEFRTAYHVAKYGTVSAASERLGVHRATIIRHIDSLEAELGGKVFFRNARGYSLTEIGEDLLRVAEATEDQFKQFIGRSGARSPGISGELVISTLDVLCETMAAGIRHYIEHNPESNVRCIVTGEIVKLEYGEAHLSIRAGAKPNDEDYVVLPLRPVESALYASKSYIQANGLPTSVESLTDHQFIGLTHGQPTGPYAWLNKHVPDVVYRFESSNLHSRVRAVLSGIGIMFMPVDLAKEMPGLVEVMPPNRAWRTKIWFVAHGATHRTAKVQSFLYSLREEGYLARKV
ncbi:MAG: LysR family transcriptional regulator [Pseudomonadota bacterium]